MYQDVHLTVHLYLCKIAFDNWQKKKPKQTDLYEIWWKVGKGTSNLDFGFRF